MIIIDKKLAPHVLRARHYDSVGPRPPLILSYMRSYSTLLYVVIRSYTLLYALIYSYKHNCQHCQNNEITPLWWPSNYAGHCGSR